MKVLGLSIEGFRGVRSTRLRFAKHTVLVGPNGSGKSTILDALSLTFGRTQLVRELTEHDFYGSSPTATSRIRIVATLGGFAGDDHTKHTDWFRDGRGVPKWWNAKTGRVEAQRSADASELCVQIGFCARFDLEELTVESLRHFHDDDDVCDPFDDELVQELPSYLLREIGFYLLPVRRTWEATISFASELFRKAVASFGGIPAATILEERDRLRTPQRPLENEPALKPLIDKINAQLARLLPQAPLLQLRLTGTDSDTLLRALVPHYLPAGGMTLPAGRHGTGLLSLQTFALLLEIGRARKEKGLPFVLAMEEPELHVPPGLQRRLVAQAVSVAEQTICSSHSPRVAAFYPATAVQIIERENGTLRATAMLEAELGPAATQSDRKLFHDDRPRVVEALMHHRLLVPEGRCDYEWLRRLADVVETSDTAFGAEPEATPPFGSVVGIVPTTDSAVLETYTHLRRMRSGIVPLVDGDAEGNRKITELLAASPPPERLMQWPDGWAIEEVVAWILRADEGTAVPLLKVRLPGRAFTTLDELLVLLKINTGPGRLKSDYLAYEAIAATIGEIASCRARAATVLEAIVAAATGDGSATAHLIQDTAGRSTKGSSVMRFQP